MPQNLITVTSSNYGEIPLHFTKNESDPNMVILEAKQPFGTIRFTITNQKKFRLWHATYRITRPTQLRVTVDKQYLGFIFSLKNNPSYAQLGLPPFNTQENHYEIFYAPHIQFQYNFKPETYILCGLNFNTPAFSQWTKIFDPLEPLINSAALNTPYRFTEKAITTTPAILIPLSNILQCQYKGIKKKKFMKIKSSEITFFALQNSITLTEHPKLSDSNFNLMLEVRDYLLSNLISPGTIRQIALKFGMNYPEAEPSGYLQLKLL